MPDKNKELRFIFDVCLGKKPRADKDLNWQGILKICGDEGLLPLFYLKLKESNDLGVLPEASRKFLENEYYVGAARNSVFFESGQEVVSKLSASGVRTLPLKGFFLNDKVYGNIAARPIADVDILVKKTDLGSADRLLQESGWKAVHDWREFVNKPLSINSCLYLKESGDYIVALHLHWHLVNSTWPLGKLVQAIDMYDIWQRADAESLSAQDQLAHLMLHGVTHQFKRMVLAFDIIEAGDFYFKSRKLDPGIFGLKCLEPLAWYSAGICEWVGSQMALLSDPSGFNSLVCDKGKIGARSYLLSLEIFYSAQSSLLDKIIFLKQLVLPDAAVLAQSKQVPVAGIKLQDYFKRCIGR